MSDERVLCAPSDYVDAVLRIDESDADKLAVLLDHTEYIPRSQCETDERWQQLVPYVVVRCNGLILAYQRAGSEKRLDGLWSIGVGGHVNDEDKAWIHGVIREIREETGFSDLIDTGMLKGPLGFLRDDSNAVGRVHLGVLYTLDVPSFDSVKMVECATSGWYTADELDWWFAKRDKLENWSRMALDVLKGN